MKNERHDFDLINELPHIYELEDMISFAKSCKTLYIYGRAWNQEHLAKYLEECDIHIDGYLVTEKRGGDDENFTYKPFPVIEYNDMNKDDSTGVIVGLSDKYYHQIIPIFRKDHFENYFLMTEYNKRAIAGQMRIRQRDVLGFEVSLADHCNLSCQMCDHFSQLADEWFVDINVFEKDMMRMGGLFEHRSGPITLLGGEPTLHKEINQCMQIARREFPDAVIGVLTNGVLLLQLENSENGNFWKTCSDNNIRVEVTVYPIKIDFEAIEKKAEEYDVELIMSSDIHAKDLIRRTKISDKHTMNLDGNVPDWIFVNCLYFNKFNVLKNGRLYMCPIAAHVDILNKKFGTDFTVDENDSLDIYDISSWKEIADWTSYRIPFCRYCDLKKWRHHSEWKASTKQIEEYV